MSGMSVKNRAEVLALGLRGLPGGALRIITKTVGGVKYSLRGEFRPIVHSHCTERRCRPSVHS